MIAFLMIVLQILIDCPPQRKFTREAQFGETLVLYGADDRSANAFRLGLRGGSRIGSMPLERSTLRRLHPRHCVPSGPSIPR
jgi:hypothetical protein